MLFPLPDQDQHKSGVPNLTHESDKARAAVMGIRFVGGGVGHESWIRTHRNLYDQYVADGNDPIFGYQEVPPHSACEGRGGVLDPSVPVPFQVQTVAGAGGRTYWKRALGAHIGFIDRVNPVQVGGKWYSRSKVVLVVPATSKANNFNNKFPIRFQQVGLVVVDPDGMLGSIEAFDSSGCPMEALVVDRAGVT